MDNPDLPHGERRSPPADPAARARAVAVALLARHGWSRAALRERLIRRGTDAAVAEQVLGELERARLIGDRAYAEDAARLELSRKPASDAYLEH
jgi:SOS response regulatory protein OraA/RecX